MAFLIQSVMVAMCAFVWYGCECICGMVYAQCMYGSSIAPSQGSSICKPNDTQSHASTPNG